MALHLRRRTRNIEPIKRVIKLEGFKDALEARKLAVLRSNAKAELSNGRYMATQRNESAGGRHGEANGGEERHRSEARENAGDAAPMEIDTDTAGDSKERRREEREAARQRRLEAQKKERERRRAEKESERKRAWEEAEQKRKGRLKAVEAERIKLESEAQLAEEDLQKLRDEMEGLNAGKAELVAQLKQVLHVDEAARTRSLPTRNSGEGDGASLLPIPPR